MRGISRRSRVTSVYALGSLILVLRRTSLQNIHLVSAFPFVATPRSVLKTPFRSSWPSSSSCWSSVRRKLSVDSSSDDSSAGLPSSHADELTRDQVESLTVPQLKQQLRLRRLKVSGRKIELQERLLQNSQTNDSDARPVDSTDDSPILDAEVVVSDENDTADNREARKFAKERGKELVDVTSYLDDKEKGKSVRSSTDLRGSGKDDSISSASTHDDDDDSDSSESSSGPEVWGREARIVDDYEGRRVVVDNLSRTVVEYKGSNQTDVKAFVVASRDALKAFLLGGEKGQNKTTSAEDRLREIQSKREVAARVPLRFEDDEGLDEGDETGLYTRVVERDYSDWGKFTQTGAQLSASEIHGVLLLSDVYGPFADDTRALAEKIAFECQPVVVMAPDLFHGHPWQEAAKTPGKNARGQTYEQWRSTHSDLRVSVDIRAAGACLRERYGVSSIAVWGTCYGGGRALETAAGYFPDDIVHDVDGSVGPPPVDPMAAIAWYPTRYDANTLFGMNHKGSNANIDGSKRNVAVMAIFAGKDTIAGATPEDAGDLKLLLEEDDRIKDHMVKVFPDQGHGFAHIGVSGTASESDEDERFVDEEFGGSGNTGLDGSDAEVACLLSTAWMETYSRVFLPTTGPAISKDENEAEWSALDMKDVSATNGRNIREEIDDALDNFVEEPLGGRSIDQTDESNRDELADLLRSMQDGEEEGPFTVKADDDLTTIYAKLKASDENFQIF